MAVRDVSDTPSDPVLNYIIQNPEAFAKNLTRMLSHANEAMAAYVEPLGEGKQKTDRTQEITEWVTTISRVTHYWLADPARAMEAQARLAKDWMALYANAMRRLSGETPPPVAAPDPTDKRFKDPDWTAIQFFDFLKQGYLITTRWAQSLVDETDDLDEHTRQKAAFYVKQLSAALSPSNFLFTNPELLRETAQRSGENLAQGMRILAEDIAAGGGELKIRQTEPGKFQLGVNMAMTEGQVIAENALAQLIQYSPQTEDVFREPIYIVPPWINKFYILDLGPGKSLIEWLVQQGHTVFLLSWVNPDERHAQYDFSRYMHDGLLWGLDNVLKAADTDKVDTVGYCIGGTLLAMTLAYLEKRGDRRINTATLLTAQVDFTHAGDLKVFVDRGQLETLEKKIAAKGYLEGSSMATAFNMLRANDLIWPYVVNNYIRGKDPFPFDLLAWNSDATRMPAANHKFYLRNFYLDNLFSLGELVVEGMKLSPADIKVPLLNVATREDHIAPALSVFTGNKMFGGPARYVLTGSGHIAGVVNPPAKNKYQVWVDGDQSGTLEEFLASATEVPGSWWPVWHDWLSANRSGDKVPARQPGGGHFNAIEPAPGRYVRMR